jgi:anti-anti-sigma regulatory factor
MNTRTHFEDLSNEIFFEIFDYLHALDIFTSFTSLNRRISSILQSIPLRIVISRNHCRRQINFLSSQLTFHAHQVISLNISDTIRDDSSIISLLFDRHKFINLESCRFVEIDPSTKLENVIKQIKSLNRLISLCIYQPNVPCLNATDRYDLTRIMLMHKSSSLRSLALQYRYNYLDISNYTSLPSNLTSIKLIIGGLFSTVSIYSIILVLRLCHTIRHLSILIGHTDLHTNNNIK